jgi:parvulin-like peptidyl-prolyl isomerase
MKNQVRFYLILACAAVCISPPLRAEVQATKTVAVVNNDPIFLSELEKELTPFVERYKATVPKEEQSDKKIQDMKKEILDRLIEEKLLMQEATAKKLRVTKAEIDRGIEQFKEPFATDPQGSPRSPIQAEKLFQEQLTKEGMTQEQFSKRVEEQIIKVKVIEQEVRSKVQVPKEEDVKAFFQKIKKKMAGETVETKDPAETAELTQISEYLSRASGQQFRIRHILVRAPKGAKPEEKAAAKKKIEGILASLKKGDDFAFLAKKSSEDPISSARGGDLGFVAEGDIGLPEIDKAVKTLSEGQMSGVIETEIGFHIIKLVEKKAPHTLEFDDVKEDLANYMAQRKFTQDLEKYLKSLKAKSVIKVNPIE